jgi:hypothetical protein
MGSLNVKHLVHCSEVAPVKAFVALLLTLVGCGGPSDRVVLRGDVTFDGKPVQIGTIRFAPIEGAQGSVTIAPIEDGKYVADSHEGVPYGTHRVEISAFDLTGFEPGPGKQPKQLIPSKYNEESALTANVDQTSGDSTIDFQLMP